MCSRPGDVPQQGLPLSPASVWIGNLDDHPTAVAQHDVPGVAHRGSGYRRAHPLGGSFSLVLLGFGPCVVVAGRRSYVFRDCIEVHLWWSSPRARPAVRSPYRLLDCDPAVRRSRERRAANSAVRLSERCERSGSGRRFCLPGPWARLRGYGRLFPLVDRVRPTRPHHARIPDALLLPRMRRSRC